MIHTVSRGFSHIVIDHIHRTTSYKNMYFKALKLNEYAFKINSISMLCDFKCDPHIEYITLTMIAAATAAAATITFALTYIANNTTTTAAAVARQA